MFNACFMLIGSWKGRKNFRVEILVSKNLLGKGYGQETKKNFLRPYVFLIGSTVEISYACILFNFNPIMFSYLGIKTFYPWTVNYELIDLFVCLLT